MNGYKLTCLRGIMRRIKLKRKRRRMMRIKRYKEKGREKRGKKKDCDY